MELPAGKLAPRAIALAMVGYCVWPSIARFFAEPEAKPPQKASEMAVSLLQPAMPPPPVRDPFVLPGAARPAPASGRAGRAANNGQLDQLVGLPAGRAAAGGSAVPGLTLEGTCIVGDRRLAIINGRLYAPRETLAEPATPTLPCKILEVFPYKVLLECQGKQIELGYSDVASAPDSRGRTAPGKSAPSRPSRQKR
jgi:hypothetical protein